MRKIGTSIALLFQAVIFVDAVLSHNYWQAAVVTVVLGWLLWLLFAEEEVNTGIKGHKAIVSEFKPIAPACSSEEFEQTEANTQSDASSARPKEEPDENRAGEVSKSSLDGNLVQEQSHSGQSLQDAANSDDDFIKALGVLKALGIENYIARENYIAAACGKYSNLRYSEHLAEILANPRNSHALGCAGYGFWKETRRGLDKVSGAFFKLEWARDAKECCEKISNLAAKDILAYLREPGNRREDPFPARELWKAATCGRYHGILEGGGKHVLPQHIDYAGMVEKLLSIGIGCGTDKKKRADRPLIYLLLEKEEASGYLENNFGKDLKTWFAMSQNEELGCDEVRSVYNHNRPQNNLIDNERRTAIFAAAFSVLIEHTLRIVNDKGEKEAAAYCKQHGWPLCNVRRYDGTLLSAKQIVENAGLVPPEMYKSFYNNAVPLFKELMA